VIHSEGRRLAEMVDQALEFAGVQSGRKSYVLRPLGVRDLVQRAINGCEAQIRDADVQIDLRVPDHLPLVLADAVELTRALQNLIRNAIKYGGERRWVGIQVQPQVSARGSELSISVHDTGIGIATEDIAHIFEPFYRSREAVAAQIHGSGLGLSLVRHIVEGHGGRVTVASTPGQGSIFTIVLPCLAADGRQPAVKPA
jgi:two-component system phosphate regulon sensor histidine kinase PhoR